MAAGREELRKQGNRRLKTGGDLRSFVGKRALGAEKWENGH
jgi:hypothetical protein